MAAAFLVRAGGSSPLLTGSEPDGTNVATTGFPGFTAGWVAENTTLTAAATLAPDGTTTAASIIENTADARHIVYYTYSGANLGAFSASVYLKAFNRRYASLMLSDDADDSASLYVDLQTGTITDTESKNTGSITSTSIAAAVNGFYKVSITGNLGASETGDRYLIICLSTVGTYGAPLNFDNPQYTGDGTSGIYAWRPKLVDL